ncbi:DNA polymerase/3'-5' exonuclease PolX [Candidatus Thermoflexus japonica]|uniref:DNA-directed DNA polymerase n=1 Tax=Candidatus Thermoflexus japonica TaxID=2035417 RepID=A0A2H5Y996_9CHLR|nr:DNA polymerase/3'-5' exonuclease PolX [Candidatus Thermoflexus japonica]
MERRWTNQEIAQIFENIADMLEIQGEIPYKVMAYRRAAENIAALGRDIYDLWQEGALRTIPGVGEAIEEKIDQLLRTGRLELYERLKSEIPQSLLEMRQIPDMGPKRIRAVWEKLGITTVEELEEAARAGKLRSLPGFGARLESKILAGIEAVKRRKIAGRVPLGVAWPLAQEILSALQEVPGVQRLAPAGSFRRMKDTIGDLDFLVAAEDPEAVMERFTTLPIVETVLLRGSTKSSVRLRTGLQADLRVIEAARWGTALQYFTGSQQHNIQLREHALKRGYSLSEYALTRVETETEILCATEEEVYARLGLAYIPPELREGRGEIEAALEGRLPRLIEIEDLQGDLQVHSTWSDGQASIREMARAAKAKGYRYMLLTDHSQSLGVAKGLTPERLWEQRREIEAVNAELGDGFRVLHGAEVEIRADGSLDYPDEVLAALDLVVASVHTGLRQEREKVTARFLAAIRHPHVHIIAHPTGRLLGEREGADADWEAVLRAAAETGTLLEINANPARLDLPDVLARRALELGCKLVISTDAHSPGEFDLIHFGVAVARRAWATREDIANTWPLERLLAWAKEKPRRLRRA